MRTCMVILFLMCSIIGRAQNDSLGPAPKAWVSLRIHPVRFLYGLNGGIDFRLTDHSAIGVTYVNHLRDFLSPLNTNELELTVGNGHSFFAQLYLERAQVVFHGPRIGLKTITFPTTQYIDSDSGDPYFLWRDQLNYYGSYSFGLRRVDQGFYVMSCVTAGVVFMQVNEWDSRVGESQFADVIYPHLMMEVGLGWSF